MERYYNERFFIFDCSHNMEITMKTIYKPGLTMDEHKALICKQAFKKFKTKRHAARALGISERIIKKWLDRK